MYTTKSREGFFDSFDVEVANSRSLPFRILFLFHNSRRNRLIYIYIKPRKNQELSSNYCGVHEWARKNETK